MRHRILKQCWLGIFLLTGATPENEILGLIRLRAYRGVAIDVCQCRCCTTVPQIGDDVAEWLKLVKSLPFGELGRTDLKLRLTNAFA